MPHNLLKFKTADTVFYYDPLAQKLASDNTMGISLLSATRFTFLGYLSLFYRYFGYRYWPVSIFHCFLGSFSVALLFLAVRLFLREKTAFIIGLVSTFQIVLVYWAPFVTIETAFLFLLSLCLFLFGLFIKTNRLFYLLMLFISLLIVAISMPSGIAFSVFMLFCLEWLVLKRLFNRKAKLYFCLINIAILIGLTAFISNSREEIDELLKHPYSQEVINLSLYLDEMPAAIRANNHLRVYGVRLTLPGRITIPKSNGIPKQILSTEILSYFRNNSDKYFTLIVCRLYTLFNPWAPEHSFRHNIFNLFFYGFIYIFSMIGLFRIWKIERRFAILILLALGSQVLFVGLTEVDYDFRHRLPIEFILNIPLGVAIASTLKIAEV